MNLTAASRELFRRTPDERFESLDALWQHCYRVKEESTDRWVSPKEIHTVRANGHITLAAGQEPYLLTDWSFGQLCRMAEVAKETINKLSSETAAKALDETLPRGNKPVQLLVTPTTARSLHGTVYSRIWDLDLVNVAKEFAVGFEPPPAAFDGNRGLWSGDRDTFIFLIDGGGWAEINGQAFAPGCFLWNSEVGRRTLGVSTFWFQAVCRNFIVWDATEVVQFSVKHTSKAQEGLGQIRRHLEQLVEVRDARRDSFVATVQKAMRRKLGDDADEVLKVLGREGIPQWLAKEAIQQIDGRFTIFSVVDALTRLSHRIENAGERVEADRRNSALLSLAT